MKNASCDELCEAIGTVVKGKQYLHFKAAQALRKKDSENVPILKRREKEVLELIADDMTNNEMTEKLFISPTMVDTHWKNLLSKFNAKNTATLIKMVVVMKMV